MASARTLAGDWITYVTAAARVADALTRDVLLAPIESSVIPLPHQIRALSRAALNDRIRYLLADEVGLGKTIEAGLIMRELKLRGLVKRTLVVAPKGLMTQWVAEMRTHFGEEFRLVIPSHLASGQRAAADQNMWQSLDQVVCPMDSVKPVEGRRGWTHEQTAEYNRVRFGDLIAAGWDLVIVDEAHRLGGSTEQVARHWLGQGLAEAAPYLLLLSATPHQGKSDAFARMISLLDAEAFPPNEGVTRERVQPYVIRTEKRGAIDAEGRPLFKPRRTQLIPVTWQEKHQRQRALYESVTDYVRDGYNRAIREKRNYIGFLMILMQRLVTSSTRAIRTSLGRRLAVLETPDEELPLFPLALQEEWAELDGQEQLETLLTSRLGDMADERAEVKRLLEAAKRCEQTGPDAKAEALLEWVYRLQQEENDPDLKILIFTEFVPTQEMLSEFLTDRGFTVTLLNGSMSFDERERAQGAFAGNARIMVSTDAGGEGLNLQFCHVVVNYDMPWNPMRLEQRIGRVDRIGQTRTVRAINVISDGTVEHRVREVLEDKLAVILEEFGVDKTGDVLDSAEAEDVFDDLYVQALLDPEAVDAKAEAVLRRIREQAASACESLSAWTEPEPLDPALVRNLMSHPLPHWVERMTVSYIRANGGKAERSKRGWRLMWPDEEEWDDVVFTLSDAERLPAARHATLEDPRIRHLVRQMPWFVAGQPIPLIRTDAVPRDVRGLWSVARICLHAEGADRERVMPLFIHDDGRVLAPTAARVWDVLLSDLPEECGRVHEEPAALWKRVFTAVERSGESLYGELLQKHRERLSRDRDKGEYAFSVRRKAIERIGLPAVQRHRLATLDGEKKEWRQRLERQAEATPELTLLLVLRVEGVS